MAVSDWSTNANLNLTLGTIALGENQMLVEKGNNAFREIMAQIAAVGPVGYAAVASPALTNAQAEQAQVNLHITPTDPEWRAKVEASLRASLGLTGQNVTNWNTAPATGFCYSHRGLDGVVGAPDGPSGGTYWYGLTKSFANANHIVTVTSYGGGATAQVWRQEYIAGTPQGWIRLRQAEADLDARYGQKTAVNTWTTTAIFNGTLYAQGSTGGSAYVSLVGGGTVASGYIEWTRPAALGGGRIGYMGYATNQINLASDIGPFVFTGAHEPKVDNNKIHHDGNTTATSAQYSITSAGLISFTHGLGRSPSNAIVQLECVVANLGYAVGDIVTDGMGDASFSIGSLYTEAASATTIISLRLTNGSPSARHKTTGVWTAITNASWRIRIVAQR
jgi:hypothetical protein